jgi:hypothetical protein
MSVSRAFDIPGMLEDVLESYTHYEDTKYVGVGT